jgi:hypothetical protein
MKYSLFKLFSWLFIFFCANCLADCCNHDSGFVACPKTYIEPDQILFRENAIFLQIADMLIQTESIKTDDQGIFFETINEEECGRMQWKCIKFIREGVRCNTCNWVWEGLCGTCWKWR